MKRRGAQHPSQRPGLRLLRDAPSRETTAFRVAEALSLRPREARGPPRRQLHRGMPETSHVLRSAFGAPPKEHGWQDLTLEGRWPKDLRGTLYRNGPRALREPRPPLRPLVRWRCARRDAGESDLGGPLPGSFSAHPHRRASDGSMVNIGIRIGRPTELDLVLLRTGGSAGRLASVTLPSPTMVHDFALTERHAIVFLAPLHIDLLPVLFGRKSFVDAHRWVVGAPTEVLVFSLDAPASPVRFSLDPFWAWHVANAFDGGRARWRSLGAAQSPHAGRASEGRAPRSAPPSDGRVPPRRAVCRCAASPVHVLRWRDRRGPVVRDG